MEEKKLETKEILDEITRFL